jgi:hypothetical protein
VGWSRSGNAARTDASSPRNEVLQPTRGNARLGATLADMFACPQCSQFGFTAWRKLNATSTFPARCSNCGGLAFVSGWAHLLSTLVCEVILWGSIIAALLLRSWLALALLPLGIAIWGVILSTLFPLKPIERGAVQSARRSSFIQLSFAALFLVAAYVLFAK